MGLKVKGGLGKRGERGTIQCWRGRNDAGLGDDAV